MKVVVIGGGIAGLSVGLRLRDSGCDVVVLERARPGRGATWASGGMIAATAENADETTDEARFARHAASLWPDFAAEIEKRSGQPIAFRRDGALIAINSDEELARHAARIPSGTSLLSSAEALRMEPLLEPGIAGALWAPDDGQVDNRAVGLALALAFVNAGGVLQVNEAVVRFEFDDRRIRGARTPFALYEADAFVIAAGAWSGDIKGIPAEALPAVVPVKGEMIALAPASGATLPIRLIWGEGVYLVPRHDRLFVGATSSREGFDSRTTDAAEDWLLSRAHRLLPDIARWTLVEHWAGLRPGSPDDLPIVGETSIPRLYVASGQYRNGILFAPAIADALHSLILERRQPPEIRAFDPKRFAGQALAAEVKVR
jgi:glycine oxidase